MTEGQDVRALLQSIGGMRRRIAAVSYTHLDVYKRQEYRRFEFRFRRRH